MSSNLDNDINFKNMYNYQSKGLITTNDNYNKYIKYLQFFFQKDHEKDKYKKEFMNDTYILIDKRDPNKKIEITPTKFINIHKFYLFLLFSIIISKRYDWYYIYIYIYLL